MPRILNDLEVEGSIEVAATGGDITLSGATSGTLTLEAAAVTTTYTLTMPAVDAVGALSSDGAGNLSFGGITFISDLDGDTRVHTEESADEDIIRMDVGDAQSGYPAQADAFLLRSSAFTIQLPQATTNSTPGGNINITAGQGKDGDPAGAGGEINITAGAGGTGNSSLVGGGDLNLASGASNNDQDAGDVNIDGGTAVNADFNRRGGSINLTAGQGASAGSGTFGGSINLTSGAGSGNAHSGSITIEQGNVPSAGSPGTGITIRTAGAVSAQSILIEGANASVSSGGEVTIRAGNSGGNNRGGDVVLDPGTGSGTGKDGQVQIAINGTESEPSIGWTGDDDTGISHPTADTLVFSMNGHQLIRLDTTELLLQGEDPFPPTIAAGGDVRMRGGTGVNANNGGDVYIQGGTGGGQNSMGADGGNVFISAADAVAATSGDGGAITLDAGNGDDNGAAGDIDLTAGNAGATGGIGGQVNITGGNSGGASSGGRVRMLGGNAGAGGTGNGGTAQIEGGVGDGAGAGGSARVTAGDGGSAGPGGTVLITAGDAGGGNDPGGQVSIDGGVGDGTGAGGNVTIDGGAGGTASGTGGSVNITAADGGASNGDGGSVDIVAGQGVGTGTDGAVSISSGGATRFEADGTGIGFFAVTPVAQQTTSSQTPATFAANSSGIVDDSATWNGYTIGDLVAILQAYGLLA